MSYEILVTVDQPNWDPEDFDELVERIQIAVSDMVPCEHYTIQEFEK